MTAQEKLRKLRISFNELPLPNSGDYELSPSPRHVNAGVPPNPETPVIAPLRLAIVESRLSSSLTASVAHRKTSIISHFLPH